MDFSWQQMSLAEYAAFASSQGDKLLVTEGVYWRSVRPLFLRPLVTCAEFPADTILPPRRTVLGGYQHAVPAHQSGNSYLNLLMFENAHGYSMSSLNWNKRKQIRVAEKEFGISQIKEPAKFNTEAYPVYLSFYKRTGYDYRADRRQPESFARWAATLFEHPKVLVVGAYTKAGLAAVSISQFVQGVVVYSTVFSETASLQRHVTGYMLHRIREAAAQTPGVENIFAGAYKYESAPGVDEFYLARGCNLLRKPALLKLSPMAHCVLRRCLPARYREMLGHLPSTLINRQESNGSASTAGNLRTTLSTDKISAQKQPSERFRNSNIKNYDI